MRFRSQQQQPRESIAQEANGHTGRPGKQRSDLVQILQVSWSRKPGHPEFPSKSCSACSGLEQCRWRCARFPVTWYIFAVLAAAPSVERLCASAQQRHTQEKGQYCWHACIDRHPAFGSAVENPCPFSSCRVRKSPTRKCCWRITCRQCVQCNPGRRESGFAKSPEHPAPHHLRSACGCHAAAHGGAARCWSLREECEQPWRKRPFSFSWWGGGGVIRSPPTWQQPVPTPQDRRPQKAELCPGSHLTADFIS